MRTCSHDLCSDCRELHVDVCGCACVELDQPGGVLAAVRCCACQAQPCLGGQEDQQECVTPPSGTQLWYYLTNTHMHTHMHYCSLSTAPSHVNCRSISVWLKCLTKTRLIQKANTGRCWLEVCAYSSAVCDSASRTTVLFPTRICHSGPKLTALETFIHRCCSAHSCTNPREAFLCLLKANVEF